MVETAPALVEVYCEPYMNMEVVKMIGTTFGLFALVLAFACFLLGMIIAHEIYVNLDK